MPQPAVMSDLVWEDGQEGSVLHMHMGKIINKWSAMSLT